jgi:tetratricopeptide (TPR) repeat protein
MSGRFISLVLVALSCGGLWLAVNSAKANDPNASVSQGQSLGGDPLLDWLIPNIAPADALGWEAQIMRARLLAEWGNSADSIRILEALLAKKPQDSEALRLLAALYLEQDQQTKIEAIIPNLQSIPELLPIALYLEGRVALWRNRAGQARSRFEAALRQTSANDSLQPTLIFYRAYTLELLGRTAEVDEGIADALQAGFKAHETGERTVLARYHLRNGRASQAMHLLERGLDARTLTDPDYLKVLADSYFASNLFALALETYSTAIAAGSEDPRVYAKRANLLRRNGDLTLAWEDFERAIALGGGDASLFLAAGINGLETGQIEAANTYLAKASEGLPGHTTVHYLSAFSHYLTDDKDGATQRLKHLSEKDHPLADEAALLTVFIGLHTSEGNIDRRVRADLNAISGGTTVPGVLRDILLKELDEKDAPVRLSRRTGERQGKDACALAFWLGEWHRLRGQTESARTHYENALTVGRPDFLEYQAAKWQLAKIP